MTKPDFTGIRRGIASQDKSNCLETLLFSMFYTTNAFDTSLLYGVEGDQNRIVSEVKALLKKDIVTPLRQSGFCEWTAIKQLKELIRKTTPDFNDINFGKVMCAVSVLAFLNDETVFL